MDTRHAPESGAPDAPLPAHPPASYAPESPYRTFDLAKEASVAKLTSGLSPASLQLALADWLIHLAAAPGKRAELATLALRHAALLGQYLLEAATGRTPAAPAQPSPGDRRFRAGAWQLEPYRFWHQSFLLAEQWWRAATRDVPGVSPHHEDVVAFSARQMLDTFAPANYVATNPEIAQRTALTGGANLAQGVWNYLDDVRRLITKQPPAGAEQFELGRNLATTPGRVVFRNHLIELLQYSPTTPDVYAQPVLIVPAWIMKYYILDLSAHNSLIRYLVGEGHTVFCISWRNVDASDRDLSLDDYRKLGVMDALDTIGAIVPGEKIHATGYCLGGTLLSIAAAAMANTGDDRLASITLLAAQTDFAEPGELQLFIDDSEIHFLESMMWERGYLGAHQMAGSFQLLMSNDLIWSRVIHDYLLGERTPMIDLMAWNADSTRMPYRMHSEYLRHLFLDNDLATNRYVIDGQTVSVHNIRAPFFVVGTEHDHIAPWRSVYKIHYLSGSDVTFVLTAGGHNAGIVSEPGHAKRHYRMKMTAAAAPSISPDEWLAGATDFEGSWWPAWHAWLARHSSPQRVAPPPLGKPGAHTLGDAPGTYVFQK